MKSIIAILQYPHYPLPPVIESYREEGVHIDRWNVCKRKKYDFPTKGWLIRLWALTFLRWIPKIGKLKNKTVFATAAHFPLLAIAKIFGSLMGDYHIYIDNFYLHALGQNRAIRSALSWLIANPRVTIFTYAPNEADYFSALSPLPTVRFIPFCSDFTPITGQLPPNFTLHSSSGSHSGDVQPGFIFSGGYSNRDYELLLRLAERFPNQTFVFVASSLNNLADLGPIPSNVILHTDLPKNQFESLLAASAIVIIPLKGDVGSSGQMLAISALRNAKPTIYTDLSVISYFFTHDIPHDNHHDNKPYADKLHDNPCNRIPYAGIPYKLNDLDSLSAALSQLLDNPTLRQTLSTHALEASAKFTTATQLRLLRQSIRP